LFFARIARFAVGHDDALLSEDIGPRLSRTRSAGQRPSSSFLFAYTIYICRKKRELFLANLDANNRRQSIEKSICHCADQSYPFRTPTFVIDTHDVADGVRMNRWAFHG
jgi:hypothetical protein